MAHEANHSAPNPFSLLGLTLARFSEAFGEPITVIDHDYQWALKTAPFANDVYVLIHGVVNRPIVWIFDANDRNDGVSRSLVESEDAIVEIIDHVRERVVRGSRVSRKTYRPEESGE